MSNSSFDEEDIEVTSRVSTMKLTGGSNKYKKPVIDTGKNIVPSASKKIVATTPRPVFIIGNRRTKSAEVISPSDTPQKHTKINHLDVQLVKMGFSILFSFHTQVEEAKIILTMSPIGTIVGIRLNIEGTITTVPERRINITTSNGTIQLYSSYLTGVSKGTEISSIIVCKEGICLFSRDKLGKIGAEHYDIKSEFNIGESKMGDSPSSYPLINMSDLIDNFLDFRLYSSFLHTLEKDSKKISKIDTDNQIKMLEQNIEFMANLLSNMTNLYSKTVDFEAANNREFKNTSSTALTLLEQRLNSSKQVDTEQWKQCQDKLHLLNQNTITLTNGVRSFNNFRRSIDIIDREDINFYFSLYSLVIRSMDSVDNMDIRKPNNWTLSKVLPRAEKLLLSSNGSVSAEDFIQKVREDIVVNTNMDTDTLVLATSFSSAFK